MNQTRMEVFHLKTIIVLGTLLIPLVFVLLRRLSAILGLLIDGLAVVSAFGFAILSAFAVLDIRKHGTVYETEVHRVFDSFWFMAFAAYLGLYLLYRLMWSAFSAFRRSETA